MSRKVAFNKELRTKSIVSNYASRKARHFNKLFKAKMKGLKVGDIVYINKTGHLLATNKQGIPAKENFHFGFVLSREVLKMSVFSQVDQEIIQITPEHESWIMLEEVYNATEKDEVSNNKSKNPV